MISHIVADLNQQFPDGFELRFIDSGEVTPRFFDATLDNAETYKTRVQFVHKLMGPFNVFINNKQDRDVQVLLSIVEYTISDEHDAQYTVSLIFIDRTDGAFLNGGVFESERNIRLKSLWRVDPQ